MSTQPAAPAAPAVAKGAPAGQSANPAPGQAPQKAPLRPIPPRVHGKQVEKGSALERRHLLLKGVEPQGEELREGPQDKQPQKSVIQRIKEKTKAPGTRGQEAQPVAGGLEGGESAGAESQDAQALNDGADGELESPDQQAQSQRAFTDYLAKLTGQKFKNSAEAENYVKRANGRASAAEKRAHESQAEVTAAHELLQQWESAFNTMSERGLIPQNVMGQAQPQQQGQPQGQQNAGTSDAGTLKPFIESVGRETWSQAEAIAQKYGIGYALMHVADTMDQHHRSTLQRELANLRGELSKQVQPVVQDHTNTQNQAKAGQWWQETVAKATHEGTSDPVFPELVNNPSAAREVSLFWLGMLNKYGKAFAFSPVGLRAAYSEWATYRQRNVAKGAEAGESTSAAIQQLAQELSQGGSSLVQSAGVSAAPSEPSADRASLIKSALKSRGNRVQSSSGFDFGRMDD